MNKVKKFKNVPLCVEKSSHGMNFHASLVWVKRMEALNKLTNNRLDLLFWRLAEGKKPKHKNRKAVYWSAFSALIGTFLILFLNCPESSKGL